MKRFFPTCAAVLLAGIVLGACGEKEEPDLSTTTPAQAFEITGEWEGTLTQKGMKPFSVEATIASLERFKENVVRYGGELACGGTWEYLGASESAYRFREVIDRGANSKCKGKGTVTLTPAADDELDYEFRGGGVVSEGVLSRV